MTTKTKDRARFYLTEQIGQKRSTTPEGFLVCHDVPIARTGTQLYSTDEIPLESRDGIVRIERLPEEVFRDDTIASFEGKPVTVEHPNDFVTPENWQQLAVGVVQNVRRGTGIDSDLLIGDLVITDAAAIEYVNKTLPEVSAGYEAAYEQTEPGRGVQRDIVGNHVALVERGRAGPRCSIQDHEGKPDMTTKAKKGGFLDRLRKFLDSEEKAMEEGKKTEDTDEEEEKEKAKTGDAAVLAAIGELAGSIKTLTADVAALKAKAKDGDDEDDEDKKKTDDTVIEAETAEKNGQAKGTVLMGDSLKQIVARAEILVPGVPAMKTTDAKKAERAEVDVYMRDTLTKAYDTEDGKAAIDPLLAGREIKALTGDSLASVFVGAAEIMRVKNNQRMADGAGGRKLTTRDFGRPTSVAAINEQNAKFWAGRTAGR